MKQHSVSYQISADRVHCTPTHREEQRWIETMADTSSLQLTRDVWSSARWTPQSFSLSVFNLAVRMMWIQRPSRRHCTESVTNKVMLATLAACCTWVAQSEFSGITQQNTSTVLSVPVSHQSFLYRRVQQRF